MEIDVLDVTTITDTDTASDTVFTKKGNSVKLAEPEDKPTNYGKFVLEGKEKVTLASKISPTETMIYTNGGYSFKYNEEDNELKKFEATKDPESAEQECDDDYYLSCQCKRVAIAKRYVTAKDVYRAWIVRKDKGNKERWALVRCKGDSASAGDASVPADYYNKDKDTNGKPKEPLLLYLKPRDDEQEEDLKNAEALIYSYKQLFIWSNHLKAGIAEKQRGALLVSKDEEGNLKELLTRAEAREKQGMLGGMTSTADGVTVWLKNNDGAAIYIYQGNKGEEKTPKFETETLEIEVKDASNKKVDKFAIWLPSVKTPDNQPEKKKIEGKIVGVSEGKLLVADGIEEVIEDQED